MIGFPIGSPLSFFNNQNCIYLKGNAGTDGSMRFNIINEKLVLSERILGVWQEISIIDPVSEQWIKDWVNERLLGLDIEGKLQGDVEYYTNLPSSGETTGNIYYVQKRSLNYFLQPWNDKHDAGYWELIDDSPYNWQKVKKYGSVPQISAAEITAATSTEIKLYSPSDVKSLIEQHTTTSANRQFLGFGYADVINVNNSFVIYAADTVGQVNSFQGYRMIRPGKVTGISLQCRCTTGTSFGSYEASLMINTFTKNVDITISNPSVSSNMGGYSATENYSFNAGDRIGVELKLVDNGGYNPAIYDTEVIIEIET